MPKYELIIYWSEEDQAFIAEVPDCRRHQYSCRCERGQKVSGVGSQWLKLRVKPFKNVTFGTVALG